MISSCLERARRILLVPDGLKDPSDRELYSWIVPRSLFSVTELLLLFRKIAKLSSRSLFSHSILLANCGHSQRPEPALRVRVRSRSAFPKTGVPTHAVITQEEASVRFVVGPVHQLSDSTRALEQSFLKGTENVSPQPLPSKQTTLALRHCPPNRQR